MSSRQEKEELQEELAMAIDLRSLEHVEKALEKGADPSRVDVWGTSLLTPLDLAIKEGVKEKDESTLDIIQALAQAVPSKVCRQVAKNTLTRMKRTSQNPSNPYDRSIPTMDRTRKICRLLLSAAQERDEDFHHKTQPTPRSTVGTWKALLFSEDFSDVTFVFDSTDDVLYAHKCVLAASSNYFAAYFKGPWGKLSQHKSGTWKTDVPYPVMRAILAYIYTGDLDEVVLLEPQQLGDSLAIAVQYQLKDLQDYIEAAMKKAMSLSSVKETLLMAHLHDLSGLKNACFDFIRRNAAEALFVPEITSIAQEYPDLWSETAMAVSGRKRPREDSD
ncbi:BTB/POZ [Seminavis robusta]|uniref:BTB/POZ n=1 Tax=Seminavis robusta TaxID=568900 RepID=A0A9N8EC08_9STRA|nr:BTB/POZ [Seminavis robusta]|eukprot:Sro862_g212480.1 BTB/POZ (332) ;mRNA; f:30444-31439